MVLKAPTGSAGTSGPKNPLTATAKEKEIALQEAKSQQLEQEFKTKHLGILGVLLWVL
jgi:phosphatidylinositol glycan class O